MVNRVFAQGRLSWRRGRKVEVSEVLKTAEGREAAGMLGKMWWLWLLMGIVWVVVALVILQFREPSVTTVGIIIGIMFLAAGIQEFVLAAWAEGWKWLWAIFGVIFIICAIVAFVYPKNTFAQIADMLGFLFLMVGIFWTIEAFATKSVNELWWFGLIAGIMMIVLAFWTAGQFFITKAYTLLAFAGIWALMHGVTDFIRAFQIRKLGKMAAS
jgi:uncharacterized membrane protein HdeD (DUF308 family)